VIRKAFEKDITRIAEILVFTKRCHYRQIFQDDLFSFNRLNVIDTAKEFLNNLTLLENILVFDDDGIVKGILNSSTDRTHKITELKELYVELFFQNQGIGQKLIDFFHDQELKKGINIIYLWVVEENRNAILFYEKHGYKYSGEKRFVESTNIVEIKYYRYF